MCKRKWEAIRPLLLYWQIVFSGSFWSALSSSSRDEGKLWIPLCWKKVWQCVDLRWHGWLMKCVTVLWVYLQAVHVTAAQIRQERGRKSAPVKHGTRPKATEVAQTSTSLSLVETSKGTGQCGKEQSFHSNLFPLETVWMGMFFFSLTCKWQEKTE